MHPQSNHVPPRKARADFADRKVVAGLKGCRLKGHSLAAIHQFGTKNGRIPARPFFPIEGNGFTEEFALEAKKIFGK